MHWGTNTDHCPPLAHILQRSLPNSLRAPNKTVVGSSSRPAHTETEERSVDVGSPLVAYL